MDFVTWCTITEYMRTYRKYTCQDLAALLKSGDRLAYTEIYDRYKTLLYQHAYKKLGDTGEAGDIVQDVFLTLWQKREMIDAEANLPGYLYTTMRNRILNVFAQKKVRNRYEDSLQQFSSSREVVTDHLVRERQMAEMIAREIDEMPEKMKEIFVLSRQHYLKNKEIAERLGISEHTVATQLKRALRHLRIRLGLAVYLSLLLNDRLPMMPETVLKNNFDTVYPIAAP